MTDSRDITFVLTSCGRFDLLAETLLTFLEHNTAPIARWLIVEDSGDAGVRDALGGVGAPLEFLVNESPVGQIASIDRAYALVDTPYVFHCEDDWRFFRAGFIEESRLVLDHRSDVSTVVVRRLGQNAQHDAALRDAPVERVEQVAFRRSTADERSPWGGYSFNPGLRRMADARALGSFAALGHERQASAWFKQRGMRLAALENPACETTGLLRHVPRDRSEQIVLSRAAQVPPAGGPTAGRVTPTSGERPPSSPGGRWAPAKRNDPCPCGSGKRFKHCHGARS